MPAKDQSKDNVPVFDEGHHSNELCDNTILTTAAMNGVVHNLASNTSLSDKHRAAHSGEGI